MSPGRRSPAARAVAGAQVVVDASIAVQWFANEPESERAARLLVDERPLLAPDLMPVEAANAWWKKVRRREMEVSDLGQAIVNLLALGIVLHPSAALLSRAARLATADEGLRLAARSTGVGIWV